MNMNFPTVPVEFARQKAAVDTEVPLPLVLVVDDEPLIAETLATILNAHGLAAITAPDGTAAAEIVGLIPPQVLITDVAMPGLNGFELAIEVSRMVPDCEIILFSGHASTCDLVNEHHAAGHNFLTLVKPVHPADLLARIFERLSLHGWPIPAGIRPRSPSPYDMFGAGWMSDIGSEWRARAL